MGHGGRPWQLQFVTTYIRQKKRKGKRKKKEKEMKFR